MNEDNWNCEKDVLILRRKTGVRDAKVGCTTTSLQAKKGEREEAVRGAESGPTTAAIAHAPGVPKLQYSPVNPRISLRFK